MKRIRPYWIGAQGVMLGWALFVAAVQPAPADLLARIDVPGPDWKPELPVYAWLVDGAAREYVLVIADPAAWAQQAGAGQVLDPTASAPGDYVVASHLGPVAPPLPPGLDVLADDGRQLIVRADAAAAQRLADAGYHVKRLPAQPMAVVAAPPVSFRKRAGTADPLISNLVASVQATNVLAWISGLSGATPVPVGGTPQTITTRHTTSGTPLERALDYAEESMESWDLAVERRAWSNSSYSGYNLVGTLPGCGPLSNEAVLVVAHIDDMPSGATAPGADDNASGCAAVLAIAQRLSGCSCDRTVKFVLFTGEEQGLLGSAVYAQQLAAAHQEVAGVVNMDMISWSTKTPTADLNIRPPHNPGYAGDYALAALFTNVVQLYGLHGALQARINAAGETGSDQASFWDNGFSALFVGENFSGDFNPYYHTTQDTLQYVNDDYCTAMIQASLAMAAHLAGVLSAAGDEFPWPLFVPAFQPREAVAP